MPQSPLRKLLYATTPILLIFAFLAGSRFPGFNFGRKDASFVKPNIALAEAGSPEKFEYLSVQTSSSCGLQPTTVESYSDDSRIQGACCSAMDLHRYQEQVSGLKKYSNISQVPQDPYDISTSLAKELFGYQKNIQLTVEQQKIYDEAMKMSHEGGPCCCRCWRWDAFEGQAKYLITEHNFTDSQIAGVWDLEDGCGGEGHEHT